MSLDSILGKSGEPVACNKFMHWWVAGAKKGDKCLCGEKTK